MKVFLYLIKNKALRRMVDWSVPPYILDVGTEWSVLRTTGLGFRLGPRASVNTAENRKISAPTGNRKTIPPVSSLQPGHKSDWAIQCFHYTFEYFFFPSFF